MDAAKYARSVNLHCPTCGCDQFKFEGGDRTVESAVCANCEREFTKDQLIDENSENINEHIKEAGREVTKDTAKQLRQSLRNAFRGSKHVKFR